MESKEIPYSETGYFSDFILSYLSKAKEVAPFYHRFPTIENFKAQLEEKSASFSKETRKVLVAALNKQYTGFAISKATQQHIDNLALTNTFTVTTGHQLNLFSGPLYFLYKIISVINLCKELQEKYPQQNFVPMYWMASEDHDFKEIQSFSFKFHSLTWKKNASGPVGRLDTNGLEEVYKEFSKLLNSGNHADTLRELFKKAYLEHNTLAEATRFLVNELFKSYGLVVIDGDDKNLKTLFQPYALQELKEQVTYKTVLETSKKIEALGFKKQVNPREINLFYIGNGFRERILKEKDTYKVAGINIEMPTPEDFFKYTDKNQAVSGNALLRPLYQEVILPNLCYVGGGGELAYWMQLKATFKEFKVPFPMLLLRNSALLVNKKQQQKATKLGLEIEKLFLPQNDLIQHQVIQNSTLDFNFKSKKEQLQQTFLELAALAKQTDASFIGAVKAQEAKQLKGLQTLEKRLLKAEKKRMYALVTRTEWLQNQLFPNQSLEERQRNFSEYYEVYGENLIKNLLLNLNPLSQKFTILKI